MVCLAAPPTGVRRPVTIRRDVTAVPLQGGYVAKQCPVRAQNDTLMPGEPLPPDPFQQRLMDHGNEFEEEVMAALRAAEPDTVVVTGGGPDAERQTAGAMGRGAPLIMNGRLTDPAGRRVGKPDLLVLAPSGSYRAVDVKWHFTLSVTDPESGATPARVSSLQALGWESSYDEPAMTPRRRSDDVLQLAHYQRILEARGFAPRDGRFGGIIGTERQITWHDLDAAVWRTPSRTAGTKLRSAMERYDFEFDFRLDIIAVARAHLHDPAIDLLVRPVRCGECPQCPWADRCGPVLQAPPGDVSLLPHVGWRRWKVHRDHGVTNRAELAALDVRTAQIVEAGVPVPDLRAAAAGRTAATPLAELGVELPGRQLRALERAAVTRVGDLMGLDRRTAEYAGSAVGPLVQQIDLARAVLGPEPAYRRRGLGPLRVPRGDVEIDIDMENVEEGCYLWGCLVTDRAGTGVAPPGYRAFATWEPMCLEVESANSTLFWDWLTGVRVATRAAGRSFRAYCYYANAENGFLRRFGLASDREEEVESFIASDEWVDMLQVWDSQLLTGRPSGLKVVAPLTGFAWPVDDPGGMASMIKYDEALGGVAAAQARRWLLSYNCGDVMATQAVREWLERTEVPGIDSLDDRWSVRPR